MDVLAEIITLLGGPGLPDPLPVEPFSILSEWFSEAGRAKATPNPDAMTLATATRDGKPSARIVLCKSIETANGAVLFYTNTKSRKGEELLENPRAALVFHFDESGRQARVEGGVTRVSEEESDRYFASRHPLSRLGAWASAQSQPVESRRAFASKVADAMRTLGISTAALVASVTTGKALTIPRPPHWGGFRLTAERVELWVNAKGRLHDRAEWTRSCEGHSVGAWHRQRLQP
ncbi:MAG: pyridoxamine 5'-phosphate oxidase [Planctomycetota bacterium]|nr:pyridoxamine 5'-phosphate oxidase [Planctomycetota bacterium]